MNRLYRFRTQFARAFTRQPSESVLLRRRVRRRVAELGRWYEDGNSDLLAFTYHPIPFPGFEGIRSHRSEAESRLQGILNVLPIKAGDWILDVGANVGYFSFGLERRGAFVEAYESNSASFEIGAALSKLHHTNVLYINKAFGACTLAYLRPRYKAALLLSVFHWIVKQEGQEAAGRVLRTVAGRSDYIFFESPHSSADGNFQHELFTSRESVMRFLIETLPGANIAELTQDQGWGARVTLVIDCRKVSN